MSQLVRKHRDILLDTEDDYVEVPESPAAPWDMDPSVPAQESSIKGKIIIGDCLTSDDMHDMLITYSNVFHDGYHHEPAAFTAFKFQVNLD